MSLAVRMPLLPLLDRARTARVAQTGRLAIIGVRARNIRRLGVRHARTAVAATSTLPLCPGRPGVVEVALAHAAPAADLGAPSATQPNKSGLRPILLEPRVIGA